MPIIMKHQHHQFSPKTIMQNKKIPKKRYKMYDNLLTYCIKLDSLCLTYCITSLFIELLLYLGSS